MLPGKCVWKPLVQLAVTGQARRFRLTNREPNWPASLRSPGLYLHVPFCRNLCPYCPYHRIEYTDPCFNLYERAVRQEIELYAPRLAGTRFSSLYIGGGTPTVNWPGLLRILAHLADTLAFHGDICIELHPASMADDCLHALVDAGATMVSIGVESTHDRTLAMIGRSHDGAAALDAVRRAVRAGFKAVNVDLMFALPGQALDEWRADVRAVLDCGADQLSTYPMFAFPYSELGRSRGIAEVTRPPHRVIRTMLEFTQSYCQLQGWRRCAVWSWLRPDKQKFSSITRHHYIGFGPSAASMTGSDFYVNTFDVSAYANRLPAQRPIAVSMPVNRRVEMAYWLYWRIYELHVADHDFQATFGPSASLEREFGHLLHPLVPAGLLCRTNGSYTVTPPGAYWIHRLQNEYSLSFINHLWGICRKQPWPACVTL